MDRIPFYKINRRRKKKLRKPVQQEHDDFSNELFTEIDANLLNVKKLLDEPNDLIIREFKIGNTDHRCAVVYLEGLTDKMLINNHIINNIQNALEENENESYRAIDLINQLHNKVLSVGKVEIAISLDKVSNALLSGDTVLIVNGIDHAITIESKEWKDRAIEEPISEALIRGPRDGFVENIQTNIALIRRRIRDSNLRLKSYQIGRRSKKDIVVAYIDGVVNQQIVKVVNQRLKSIDLDDAQESGFIEEWIEDNFLSPFPQLSHTERPDKVSADLMQGKVAILLDGTPFVLVAPFTFGNSLQSPEDHYERWIVASLIRLLRYIGAFIAVFLPSLYIALVSFHPGLIPSKLAFSIAASREGVPFPAYMEAFLMELTMELLREAGIRLPKPIGQTIGIVGGLVIGEAAVAAGIVSPIMVIIVAVTAVSSFSMPSYSTAFAFRILRFGFMGAAALFGLYGIILGYIIVNIHLVNLKSFGVPYSTPFAPGFTQDWKDLIFRAPITALSKRPEYLQTEDTERIGITKGRKSP
ncbi:spore germination protein [Alkalihalobacillus sp. TS-13]|uniref:spore germination protein n=1 Tax=Alkalihalobacillus sp. TS-13 TaxID=2842455 RepID=UPI0021A987CA|nr:spore germination protein [Alkalihalobacillus sp. TS-13]